MSSRTMISPGEACKLVAPKFDTRRAAQSFLLSYVATGEIYLHATNTFDRDGKEAPNKRVARETIRRQRGSISPSFWQSAEWTYGTTTFTGIQFDKNEVVRAAQKYADGFARDPARDPAPGSGRSARHHGEPCATIALRYAKCSAAELERVTATSLREELADEYRRVGANPPSDLNLDGICSGILKAIKAAQFEAENPQKT